MTHITPLTPDHLPALLQLCERSLPLDPFTLPLLQNRIFADPRTEPALTLGIERDGRLVAAAAGIVRTASDNARHGWIKLLAVDPDHRRQGIATALLAELQARFLERQVQLITTAGAPWYFWPGVDVRYTPACCLFEKLGFTERRYNINMAVDLDQDFDLAAEEQRLKEQNLAVLRADAASLPAILEFIQRDWPLWTQEVPIALTNQPASLFFVAYGERVVGFAAYDCAMFKGTFGPMGTDPDLRRHGIGRVLLKKCLQEMKDLNYPRCEIAWVGPMSFYARAVNARITRVFREYHKPVE